MTQAQEKIVAIRIATDRLNLAQVNGQEKEITSYKRIIALLKRS